MIASHVRLFGNGGCTRLGSATRCWRRLRAAHARSVTVASWQQLAARWDGALLQPSAFPSTAPCRSRQFYACHSIRCYTDSARTAVSQRANRVPSKMVRTRIRIRIRRRASNRETPPVYTVYKYLYKLGLLASGGGRERSGEARAASLRGAPHRSRTPPGASSTRCQTGNPRWIGSSRAPRARLVCSDTRLIISRRNCHRSVSLCKILRPSASLRARP